MFLRLQSWLRRLANPPRFAVQFHDGLASLAHGRAPAGFVDDCTAIAAEFGIRSGWLEARQGNHGPQLTFSPAIPAAAHQRLRNVFGLPAQRC